MLLGDPAENPESLELVDSLLLLLLLTPLTETDDPPQPPRPFKRGSSTLLQGTLADLLMLTPPAIDSCSEDLDLMAASTTAAGLATDSDGGRGSGRSW